MFKLDWQRYLVSIDVALRVEETGVGDANRCAIARQFANWHAEIRQHLCDAAPVDDTEVVKFDETWPELSLFNVAQPAVGNTKLLVMSH